MDQIIADLRTRGLRITPQRRLILRLLHEAEGHLTAQEVYERVRPVFPDVSLDTVYRTLRTLAVLGVACQAHLQTPHASQFGLASGRHHHHMICIECGDTVEILDCPLAPFLEAAAARHAFRPAGHALEVYGYCAECSGERG